MILWNACMKKNLNDIYQPSILTVVGIFMLKTEMIREIYINKVKYGGQNYKKEY